MQRKRKERGAVGWGEQEWLYLLMALENLNSMHKLCCEPPSPVHDLCEGWDFALEGVRVGLWLCQLQQALRKGCTGAMLWLAGSGLAANPPCQSRICSGLAANLPCQSRICSGCSGSGAGSCSLCLVRLCKTNVVISVSSFLWLLGNRCIINSKRV